MPWNNKFFLSCPKAKNLFTLMQYLMKFFSKLTITWGEALSSEHSHHVKYWDDPSVAMQAQVTIKLFLLRR